jgi:hypothetical protein
MHCWIRRFVEDHMHKRMLADDVFPGLHQEVMRKIIPFSVNPGHISLERLRTEYGCTL